MRESMIALVISLFLFAIIPLTAASIYSIAERNNYKLDKDDDLATS